MVQLDLEALRTAYASGSTTPSDVLKAVYPAIASSKAVFVHTVPLEQLLSQAAALEAQPVEARGQLWGEQQLGSSDRSVHFGLQPRGSRACWGGEGEGAGRSQACTAVPPCALRTCSFAQRMQQRHTHPMPTSNQHDRRRVLCTHTRTLPTPHPPLPHAQADPTPCCPVPATLPPTHAGVPFAVKDNVDVAGMPTTAACPAFSYTPAASAPAVDALLKAGGCCTGHSERDVVERRGGL